MPNATTNVHRWNPVIRFKSLSSYKGFTVSSVKANMKSVISACNDFSILGKYSSSDFCYFLGVQ